MQPIEQYSLEKTIFTDEDFSIMGWHDSLIHGISFGENFQLFFDIDYIFKWVLVDKHYMFWVSPCTLVFENVYNVDFDLKLSSLEIEIDSINRENPIRPRNAEYIKHEVEFDWIIETQQGTISFKSIGYKQYVRESPQYISAQNISLENRKGISFDKITY